MPLSSRSNRTFIFDVPKGPISDGGNQQSDPLLANSVEKPLIESLDGRLHGEFLRVFQFASLTETQLIIDV